MARQIGLRDLTIAILKSDTSTGTTYDPPEKLERSISAKLSPKSNSEKVYSDDSVEEVINSLDSVDVEIELNQLTLASRAKLQGAKLVNGILKESKDDIAPTLALGFRSKKTNGKYRYVWLYKGSFAIPDDQYDTEEDKVKTQTAKLKGTFYPRESDGAYRVMADDDEVGIDATIIENWFTQVQNQPAVIP